MPRQSGESAIRARQSSLHGRSRQVLHQVFVLGCAERVEVIRHSPVDSLTATETGPQQDFDNTENVVETPPWPIDTLRAGPGSRSRAEGCRIFCHQDLSRGFLWNARQIELITLLT